MTVRNPYSSVRDEDTYRRRRSASTRSSCRTGSASMIFASATARTRPPDSWAMIRATARSTTSTRSAGRWRESFATRRAMWISASPLSHTFQVCGSRNSRSRTSATALVVAVTPVPRASAISPRQKSCTPGVPSPPSWISVSHSWTGSPECTAAHCASTPRSRTSASRRARTASDEAASKAAASSSGRSSFMETTLDATTDSEGPRNPLPTGVLEHFFNLFFAAGSGSEGQRSADDVDHQARGVGERESPERDATAVDPGEQLGGALERSADVHVADGAGGGTPTGGSRLT